MWQLSGKRGKEPTLDDEGKKNNFLKKDNINKKTVHKNESNEASLDIPTGLLAS